MDMATTLTQVNSTLATLDKPQTHQAVSANLEQFTGQRSTQQLPESLNQSLKQLQETLRRLMMLVPRPTRSCVSRCSLSIS